VTAKVKGLMISLLCGLSVPLAPIPGEAQDTSPTRWLCAVSTVLECGEDGACERRAVEDANLPRFLTVDLARKALTALDGSERSTPIERLARADGRAIVQGSQGSRAWSATIAEGTGRLSAAVADDRAAFALFGACLILPPAK
jgi:hypothetical protein